MNSKKYLVIAKYTSKYGQVLYCAEIKGDSLDLDFNNVYINTLYFKGKTEIKINELYDFATIKGENGYTYCFEC